MRIRQQYLSASAAMALACVLAGGHAEAGSFKTLYLFGGGTQDGGHPVSQLLPDGAGGFYGTTALGGGKGCASDSGAGCVTAFHYSASGKETVLYAFEGGSDGSEPLDPLIADSAGNLYGTTALGGSNSCNAPSGCGTVFKISPSGEETQLYVFQGSDGAIPYAPLIADSKGNLYGTTAFGGNGAPNCPSGCGTAFEITSKGKFQVLYAFTGGADLHCPIPRCCWTSKAISMVLRRQAA